MAGSGRVNPSTLSAVVSGARGSRLGGFHSVKRHITLREGNFQTAGMHDLTGFQRDALYAIAALESPKGVQIQTVLEDYYSSEINPGRLYPNLDTLNAKGLVEKGKKNDRTNEYSLTTRGRREIEARQAWEADMVASEIEPVPA